MTLPTKSEKSGKAKGIDSFSFSSIKKLILANSMNTSCTSSNFPMNPFFSTLFPNLASQQQQQQQQLFTQLLLSGIN